MSNVIVLNASYEPLGVVSLRRALHHLLNQRAEAVKVSESEFITTAGNTAIAVPIAIRFNHMIKVPFRNREMSWSRKKMLERDGYKCAYCGKHGTTVDHIVPQSRGGKNTWLNTVAACLSCNGKKANKTPDEAHMKLMYQPRVVYTQEALIASIAATGHTLESLFEM